MPTTQVARRRHVDAQRLPAQGTPQDREPADVLADAICRARRSGDRGVVVVKRGARIISARPCRSVPAGVIQMTASPDPDEVPDGE